MGRRTQPPSATSNRTVGLGSKPKKLGTVSGYTNKTEHPHLIKRDADKHITSPDHNAHIVIGGDRIDSVSSGYGAVEDNAGEIRLVVGIGRPEREEQAARKIGGIDELYTNFDPKTDGAFIKISEKAAIDHEMNLTAGSIGNIARRSAIGMSADGIRITADEGIKLITKRKRRNSKGALNSMAFGVDIIAGNSDKGLEPMVKGKKLLKALRQLKEEISDLNTIIIHILEQQIIYNAALATHFHFSPWWGLPTTPGTHLASFATTAVPMAIHMGEMYTNQVDLNSWEYRNLYPMGAGYVCSRYNNVN